MISKKLFWRRTDGTKAFLAADVEMIIINDTDPRKAIFWRTIQGNMDIYSLKLDQEFAKTYVIF